MIVNTVIVMKRVKMCGNGIVIVHTGSPHCGPAEKSYVFDGTIGWRRMNSVSFIIDGSGFPRKRFARPCDIRNISGFQLLFFTINKISIVLIRKAFPVSFLVNGDKDFFPYIPSIPIEGGKKVDRKSDNQKDTN